ncbi:MAG: hypothetical protein HYY00_05315 [Chloroflexi bacterium]|nr:hypothetical protein [Chloroflexota bacterium]
MAKENVRYFEDVELGEELGPLVKVPTTEAVRQFCSVWDPEVGASRFTDEATARKEGLPHALLPGIMNMSYLITLLTTWAPAGQVRKLDTVFRQPVPHNKSVRLVGIVTDKNVVDGENRVECDVSLQREDGEAMVTGKAVVILPSRESR